MFKTAFVYLAVAALVCLIVAWLAHRWLPPYLNPFAPLNMSEQPSFITQFKIARLKSDPGQCFAILEASQLSFDYVSDKETGESCGFYNTLRLKQSGISYGGNITLTCPALVALGMWEYNHVQPLAEEILGQKVQKIKHYGTYSCRNINSAKKGRRSQHAYANAIDIAGFQLQDGSSVSVLKHWQDNTEKGEFIRAMHSTACDYFKTVLGPKYNDLHRDHFHFDMGPSLVCR